MEEEEFLTREQLQEVLDTIITEEKSFILESKKLLKESSKEEILAMYTSNLAAFFIYLGVYVITEEYEVCSDIKKAITLERETFKSFLKQEREDLEDEVGDMIEYIHTLEENLYKTISRPDLSGKC